MGDEFVAAVKVITKKFEERLENERRIRAEVTEQLEHLRDEVLDIRRELQKRDEQDRRRSVEKPFRDVYWEYSGDIPTVPTVPRGTIGPTISTSGTSTGSSGSKS